MWSAHCGEVRDRPDPPSCGSLYPDRGPLMALSPTWSPMGCMVPAQPPTSRLMDRPLQGSDDENGSLTERHGATCHKCSAVRPFCNQSPAVQNSAMVSSGRRVRSSSPAGSDGGQPGVASQLCRVRRSGELRGRQSLHTTRPSWPNWWSGLVRRSTLSGRGSWTPWRSTEFFSSTRGRPRNCGSSAISGRSS